MYGTLDYSGKFGFGMFLLALLLIENSPSLIPVRNLIFLDFTFFLTNTGGTVVWSNPDMEPAFSDPATVRLSSMVVQDHENRAAQSVKNCTCPVLVIGPGRRPRNHHPVPHIGDNEFGLPWAPRSDPRCREMHKGVGSISCYISQKPV
jgi:hypothetical protein